MVEGPTEWVTITTHVSASLAQLDAAALRERGIAVLLPDAETSSTLWHATIALGGSRVQVPADRVAEAQRVLGLDSDTGAQGDEGDDLVGDAWRTGGTLQQADARWAAEAAVRPNDKAWSAATALPLAPVERAVRAALVGFFFPPLHAYAVYLAVIDDPHADERTKPMPGWYRVAALVVSIPSVLAQLWILASILRG